MVATIVLDFDGTLAPIRRDPSEVKISRGALSMICGALDAGARVFILSGRPNRFLRMQGIDRRAKLLGNFGSGSSCPPLKSKKSGDGARALSALRAIPGINVEQTLGWSVNWRRASESNAYLARKYLAMLLRDAGAGCRVVHARKSAELLPGCASTKTDSLRRILSSSGGGVVVFAGDDQSDLDAMLAFRKNPDFIPLFMASGEVACPRGIRKLKSRGELSKTILRICNAGAP